LERAGSAQREQTLKQRINNCCFRWWSPRSPTYWKKSEELQEPSDVSSERAKS